ncbi:MAG: NADH-quinone oxidoreductase subunit F, partial [Actinomyces sp.]|nr:NADH-quinone oxidoreductase subunit F [Actinomyces sp.]
MSSLSAPSTLTPILTRGWDAERSWTLQSYLSRGGYEGLKAARALEPSDIVEKVKAAGLRGRGGAGFPTGLKWSFLPPDDGKPRYLVVNADESEPGTCKDIPLIMANPHILVEGMAITCRAINCHHAFVYLRGEVVHVYRRLLNAIREAEEAGLLEDLRIIAHAGAGAYICGEETALLDSLEGRRGHPRLKPPFPAAEGLYARPTVINNAESISQVPGIFRNGDDWYASMGTEKS